MLDISQFRQYVVVPALSQLQLYTKDAEEIVVFTCAAESDGGSYLAQVKGPALGIYQCEPDTHNDIWRNYLFHRTNLMAILAMNFDVPRIPDVSRLVFDLKYATAICRLHYARSPGKLPDAKDVDGIWEYYKKFYNTPKGKSTKDKAISSYYRFLKQTPPKKESP